LQHVLDAIAGQIARRRHCTHGLGACRQPDSRPAHP
jgi:hypothetical protein